MKYWLHGIFLASGSSATLFIISSLVTGKTYRNKSDCPMVQSIFTSDLQKYFCSISNVIFNEISTLRKKEIGRKKRPHYPFTFELFLDATVHQSYFKKNIDD